MSSYVGVQVLKEMLWGKEKFWTLWTNSFHTFMLEGFSWRASAHLSRPTNEVFARMLGHLLRWHADIAKKLTPPTGQRTKISASYINTHHLIQCTIILFETISIIAHSENLEAHFVWMDFPKRGLQNYEASRWWRKGTFNGNRILNDALKNF